MFASIPDPLLPSDPADTRGNVMLDPGQHLPDSGVGSAGKRSESALRTGLAREASVCRAPFPAHVRSCLEKRPRNGGLARWDAPPLLPVSVALLK